MKPNLENLKRQLSNKIKDSMVDERRKAVKNKKNNELEKLKRQVTALEREDDPDEFEDCIEFSEDEFGTPT